MSGVYSIRLTSIEIQYLELYQRIVVALEKSGQKGRDPLSVTLGELKQLESSKH